MIDFIPKNRKTYYLKSEDISGAGAYLHIFKIYAVTLQIYLQFIEDGKIMMFVDR